MIYTTGEPGICQRRKMFHRPRTTFLRYVTGPEAVAMDQENVTVATTWSTPASVKDVQRFIGIANLY